MKRSSKTMIAAGLTFTAALQQARADVVVIVSAQSTITSVTPNEISRVYLGDSNTMTPLDIENPSVARRDFYTKIVGKEESQVRAKWSKLVFTGKGAAPKVFPSGEEVVKAVAANPNAIAYVDRSFVNMTVKIILTVK